MSDAHGRAVARFAGGVRKLELRPEAHLELVESGGVAESFQGLGRLSRFQIYHARLRHRAPPPARRLVECFISKIKRFRRVAPRHYEIAQAFMPVIYIAPKMIWLK